MLDEARLKKVREWLDRKPLPSDFECEGYRPSLSPLVGWKLRLVDRRQRLGLPHWTLEGATYFVTFRLVDPRLGPILRAHDWRPARIFEEFLFYDYRIRYDLDAYVIMPDHVHLLIKPLSGHSIGDVLGKLKGRSSRFINKSIRRRGALWEHDSFDVIMRSFDHWLAKMHYIHQNPVRAGLVERAEEYPWSSLLTMHSKGRLRSFPWGGPD